ncbi:MAG: type VI secretion system baseplate subunit TssE [Alphaproteobacteria bacterium]|nr:type VI secretion system baseplate subunit TssE [Alphaproteobacteria bacterium]
MSVIQQVQSQPKNRYGIKSPLFDRLVDEDPGQEWENTNSFFLEGEAVVQSVMAEVSKILNTRFVEKRKTYTTKEDGILSFGLPSLFGLIDFSSLDAANSHKRKKIAKICEKTIRTFEPRITSVDVQVANYSQNRQSLSIVVRGAIKTKASKSKISFPVVIDCKESPIKVGHKC